ncbi:unnamed protein product [Vitrella brassicaformis CCMP3155]|uniref:VWFA domain-containing protein n=1 Tax=Vitrella brassicaformis (strain CCMP3155) TaxID=1169540 RepID=A0A0G4ESR6_VITBC|nr:unnamed protein product [Vitrella brassicaformis CCMP3155]|mmetsp:Transcript_5889/g.14095  ORF Transcript_5889/g.14095 Transcript_5889/m.14095 type:complete len:455 (-) Transcript_5889:257-1621(-)|eukprot:CEM00918.1 unnamed protein product [Vitrella brassicaformis CCMP3155]
MPLEATLLCIDNSEYTRNGDVSPTRFEAQLDSANLICGAKTQQHPENSVGIMTMAGERVEVRVTPTVDLGKMLSGLSQISIAGTSDFLRGIQTAQLALKHRPNKNQKQRIVCFIGSPVEATEKQLETIGKNLKKNNVALDLISFGDTQPNSAKLSKLIATVDSNNNSHLVEVPSDRILSDYLLSSPIIEMSGGEDGVPMDTEGGGVPGGAATGGGGANEFGVDPNADPELYMALRISLEEERSRQQKGQEDAPAGQQQQQQEQQPAQEGGTATATAQEGQTQAQTAAAPAAPADTSADRAMTRAEIEAMEGVDDELRQALLLSLQEDAAPPAADVPMEQAKQEEQPAAPAAATAAGASASAAAAGGGGEGQTAAAAAAASAGAGGAAGAGGDAMFQDPAFVERMLGSLPGVDVNDPRIREALQQLHGGQGEGPSGAEGGDKKDGDKKDDSDKKQ